MAATPTEQQALAEEHNTTNCPLLCLPAELRIQIEEYATSCSNDPKSWASLQTDLHPNTTHAGYLQTRRLLRTEMLPLYLNTPELYFQCYPQPIGATALFTRHVPIIKRWVELVIAERDVSRDRVGVSVMLGRNVDKAQQDVEVSFSCRGWPPKHEIWGGGNDGSGCDEYGSIRVFIQELNERSESENRGLEKDDVRKLFAILCGLE